MLVWSTLLEEETSTKIGELFYQWRIFLPSIFLPTIIFTDKYFYRYIFTKKNI